MRALDWDVQGFAADYGRALEFLTARCRRTLALTIPHKLGVPAAGAKVGEANAVIERLAGDHGALIVDLRDFGARNHVMADRVHPSAFGQVAIAERALAVLARDGLPTRVAPASLISYETTRGRAPARRSDLRLPLSQAVRPGRSAGDERQWTVTDTVWAPGCAPGTAAPGPILAGVPPGDHPAGTARQSAVSTGTFVVSWPPPQGRPAGAVGVSPAGAPRPPTGRSGHEPP